MRPFRVVVASLVLALPAIGSAAEDHVYVSVIADSTECEIKPQRIPCSLVVEYLRSTLKVALNQLVLVSLGGKYQRISETNREQVSRTANSNRRAGYTKVQDFFA